MKRRNLPIGSDDLIIKLMEQIQGGSEYVCTGDARLSMIKEVIDEDNEEN